MLKNSQLNRCLLHRDIWQSMNQSNNQESLVDVCSTISEALEIIEHVKDNNDGAKIDVLFTGSIHLIGSTLSLIANSSEPKNVKKFIIKQLKC